MEEDLDYGPPLEEEKVTAEKPISERGERKRKEYASQKRLYNALSQGGDPIKLKEIIGAKTVAEVYRTLDKLTIRREFHDALTKAGITFEFLIEGIKREAIGGDKSMDRLKAYEMLLKTLGLDKYDDVNTGSTSSWEERLLKAIETHETDLNQDVPMSKEEETDTEYKVKVPKIPVSVQKTKMLNEEMENSLYEGFPQPATPI